MVEISNSPVKRSLLSGAACVIAVLAGFWGCGSKQAGPGPAGTKAAEKEAVAAPSALKKPAPFFHTVRYQGETLSIIAQWYTGQMSNWEDIAKANPNMNPNQIEIDDQVVIPRELLKTDKPMPQSFVQDFLPKPKPAPKKKSEPAAPAPAKKEAAGSRQDSGGATEPKTGAVKPAPAKSAPASQPPVIFGPKDY